MGALLQITRTVPIVFVDVTDPVGGGLVASLARPGGNATGFSTIEYGVSVKWLELLKEIAPLPTRVAVLRNTTIAGGGQFGAIQSVASSLGMELRPIDPGDAGEIERALAAFARGPNDGLIVTVGGLAALHRDLIIRLAATLRVAAIYPTRFYATSGGLLSYGPDSLDQYRRAAGYVDRILKGEKPADLPVQAPTKYELVINLRTARRSASTCRRRCLRAPTRLLNEAPRVNKPCWRRGSSRHAQFAALGLRFRLRPADRRHSCRLQCGRPVAVGDA